MTKPGDALALYLILLVIGYFLIRRWLPVTFSSWLLGTTSDDEEEEIEGEIPDLLRSQGYRVTEAKVKVPLSIEIADEKKYDSRLYIDYIATPEEEKDAIYLVFRERKQKPFQRTGASLRDRFLPFYLLYRPQGILFVTQDRRLLQIEMDVPDCRPKEKNPYQQWLYISVFLAGMLVHWFMT